MTPAHMSEAMQPPTTRRNTVRWLQLIIRLVGIISCLPVVWAANYVLIGAQGKLCSAASFMYGPTQLGHVLIVVPWFFVALPITMILANTIERAVRRRAGRADEAGFRASIRELRTILPWLVLPALAVSLFSMPSHYCASDAGITLKKAIWSPLLNYHWQDVRAVRTECFHRGRQNRDSFQLIMNDGATIDLADRPQQFIATYPRIHAVLWKVDFSFSTAGLDQCPQRLRPLFASRPDFN